MTSKLLRGYGKDNGHVIDNLQTWNFEDSLVDSIKNSDFQKLPSTYLTKRGNLVLFTHPDQYFSNGNSGNSCENSEMRRAKTTVADLLDCTTKLTEVNNYDSKARYRDSRSLPGNTQSGYLGLLKNTVLSYGKMKGLYKMLTADPDDGYSFSDFDLNAFLHGKGPPPQSLTNVYQQVKDEELQFLRNELRKAQEETNFYKQEAESVKQQTKAEKERIRELQRGKWRAQPGRLSMAPKNCNGAESSNLETELANSENLKRLIPSSPVFFPTTSLGGRHGLLSPINPAPGRPPTTAYNNAEYEETHQLNSTSSNSGQFVDIVDHHYSKKMAILPALHEKYAQQKEMEKRQRQKEILPPTPCPKLDRLSSRSAPQKRARIKTQMSHDSALLHRNSNSALARDTQTAQTERQRTPTWWREEEEENMRSASRATLNSAMDRYTRAEEEELMNSDEEEALYEYRLRSASVASTISRPQTRASKQTPRQVLQTEKPIENKRIMSTSPEIESKSRNETPNKKELKTEEPEHKSVADSDENLQQTSLRQQESVENVEVDNITEDENRINETANIVQHDSVAETILLNVNKEKTESISKTDTPDSTKIQETNDQLEVEKEIESNFVTDETQKENVKDNQLLQKENSDSLYSKQTTFVDLNEETEKQLAQMILASQGDGIFEKMEDDDVESVSTENGSSDDKENFAREETTYTFISTEHAIEDDEEDLNERDISRLIATDFIDDTEQTTLVINDIDGKASNKTTSKTANKHPKVKKEKTVTKKGKVGATKKSNKRGKITTTDKIDEPAMDNDEEIQEEKLETYDSDFNELPIKEEDNRISENEVNVEDLPDGSLTTREKSLSALEKQLQKFQEKQERLIADEEAAAEEAALQKRQAREERETKRKEELEKRKEELRKRKEAAAQKRNAELALQRSLAEKAGDLREQQRLKEEERRRREEEDDKLEEELEEAEREARRLAREEEVRLRRLELENEERSQEEKYKLQQEREEYLARLQAEADALRAEEEAKGEAYRLEKLEEKRLKKEAAEAEAAAAERRRQEIEAQEARLRAQMQAELERRREEMRRRQQYNLELRKERSELVFNHSITPPFQFSYFVNWPRELWERPFFGSTTKQQNPSFKFPKKKQEEETQSPQVQQSPSPL